MSEPMQPTHDGGMKQPPQTSPTPEAGPKKIDGADERAAEPEGGMIGEGDDGADV